MADAEQTKSRSLATGLRFSISTSQECHSACVLSVSCIRLVRYGSLDNALTHQKFALLSVAITNAERSESLDSSQHQQQQQPDSARNSSDFGYTGLRNADGRTCFLNAVFSSLLGVLAVRETCSLTDTDEADAIDELSRQFVLLAEQAQAGFRVRNSSRLLRELIRVDDRFAEGQQDAAEALQVLLDQLTKSEAFVREEQNAFLRDFGRVEDEKKECLSCDHSWSAYGIGHSTAVQLAIADRAEQAVPLASCLAHYTSGDVVDGFRCPACKQVGSVSRTLRTTRGPNVLVLQLKRMKSTVTAYDRRGRASEVIIRKLHTRIVVPLTIGFGGRSYSLRAACLHSGANMNSGHYTNLCKLLAD